MPAMRYLIAGLLAATLTWAASAADDAKAAKKGALAFQENSNPLVPAEALGKLKLEPAQKEKADKLFQEFESKNKEAAAKAKEESAKLAEEAKAAKQNKDKAAIKQTLAKLQTVQSTANKVRDDFEGKFAELLNDEQKKAFEELKKDFPRAAAVAPKKKADQ